jgi:TP901 family phage tail tape measure protein
MAITAKAIYEIDVKGFDIANSSIEELLKRQKELRDLLKSLPAQGSASYGVLDQELRNITKGSLTLDKAVGNLTNEFSEGRNRVQDFNRELRRGVAVEGSINDLRQRVISLNRELDNTKVGTSQFIKLQSEVRDATDELRELESASGRFQRNVGNYGLIGETISNTFKRVGKDFLAAFSIDQLLQRLDRAFDFVIEKGEVFQATLNELSAITGAAGAELDAYREAALNFGVTIDSNTQSTNEFKDATGEAASELAEFNQIQGDSTDTSRTLRVSASEVTEAFKLVGSAKPELLELREDLIGVTEQSLILSKASGLELPESIRAVTGSLNQFSAGANQTSRFVNALAAASQAGAVEVPQITASIERAGTVAANAGISFEELTSATELLGERAITGANAGFQLRATISRLSGAVTTQAREVLSGLGIDLDVVTDSSLSLRDRLQELTPLVDPNNPNSATDLIKVFGIENQTTASILLQNLDRYDELNERISGQRFEYDNLVRSLATFNNLESDTVSSLTSIGVDVGKVSDTLLPLNERFAALEPILKDQALATEVFGNELTDTLFRAFEEGGGNIQDFIESLAGTDTALEQAFINAQGYSFAQENLNATLESFGITLFQSIEPALTSTVNRISSVIGALQDWVNGTGVISEAIDRNIVLLRILGAILVGVTSRVIANTVSTVRNNLAKRASNLLTTEAAIAAGQATLAQTVYTTAVQLFTNKIGLATAASRIFNAVLRANPVGLVVTAVLALGTALFTLYERSEFVRNSLQVLGQFFRNVFGGLIASAEVAINRVLSILEPFIDTARSILNGLSSSISGIWDQIADTLEPVLSLVSNLFQFYINLYSGIWRGLVKATTFIFTEISDFVKDTLQDIQRVFESVSNVASNAWEVISSSANSAFDSIRNSINSLFQNISTVFNFVSQLFQELLGPVVQRVQGLGQSISQFFSGIGQNISTVLNFAFALVDQVFGPVVSRIKSFGNSVEDFFGGIRDRIVGFFSGLVDNISGAFGDLFNFLGIDVSPLLNAFDDASEVTDKFSEIGEGAAENFNEGFKTKSEELKDQEFVDTGEGLGEAFKRGFEETNIEDLSEQFLTGIRTEIKELTPETSEDVVNDLRAKISDKLSEGIITEEQASELNQVIKTNITFVPSQPPKIEGLADDTNQTDLTLPTPLTDEESDFQKRLKTLREQAEKEIEERQLLSEETLLALKDIKLRELQESAEFAQLNQEEQDALTLRLIEEFEGKRRELVEKENELTTKQLEQNFEDFTNTQNENLLESIQSLTEEFESGAIDEETFQRKREELENTTNKKILKERLALVNSLLSLAASDSDEYVRLRAQQIALEQELEDKRADGITKANERIREQIKLTKEQQNEALDSLVSAFSTATNFLGTLSQERQDSIQNEITKIKERQEVATEELNNEQELRLTEIENTVQDDQLREQLLAEEKERQAEEVARLEQTQEKEISLAEEKLNAEISREQRILDFQQRVESIREAIDQAQIIRDNLKAITAVSSASTEIAASAAVTSAKGAEAVAKTGASLPFPANLIAIASIITALIAGVASIRRALTKGVPKLETGAFVDEDGNIILPQYESGGQTPNVPTKRKKGIGGMHVGARHSGGGIMINVEGGEYELDRVTTSMFRPEIEWLHSQGLKKRFGGTPDTDLLNMPGVSDRVEQIRNHYQDIVNSFSTFSYEQLLSSEMGREIVKSYVAEQSRQRLLNEFIDTSSIENLFEPDFYDSEAVERQVLIKETSSNFLKSFNFSSLLAESIDRVNTGTDVMSVLRGQGADLSDGIGEVDAVRTEKGKSLKMAPMASESSTSNLLNAINEKKKRQTEKGQEIRSKKTPSEIFKVPEINQEKKKNLKSFKTKSSNVRENETLVRSLVDLMSTPKKSSYGLSPIQRFNYPEKVNIGDSVSKVPKIDSLITTKTLVKRKNPGKIFRSAVKSASKRVSGSKNALIQKPKFSTPIKNLGGVKVNLPSFKQSSLNSNPLKVRKAITTTTSKPNLANSQAYFQTGGAVNSLPQNVGGFQGDVQSNKLLRELIGQTQKVVRAIQTQETNLSLVELRKGLDDLNQIER